MSYVDAVTPLSTLCKEVGGGGCRQNVTVGSAAAMSTLLICSWCMREWRFIAKPVLNSRPQAWHACAPGCV